MRVVVDTSITLAWLLPDESSLAADAVLERITGSATRMLAPALWIEETANALLTAHRRERLTEAQLIRALELIAGIPVEFPAQPPDRSALVTAALRSGLSAYDATYMLLAERTGSALATLDARLAEAARAAGIDVWPSNSSNEGPEPAKSATSELDRSLFRRCGEPGVRSIGGVAHVTLVGGVANAV